jgi:hypothetical protein
MAPIGHHGRGLEAANILLRELATSSHGEQLVWTEELATTLYFSLSCYLL